MTRFGFHTVVIIVLASCIHACASSKKTLTPDEFREWYGSEDFIWKSSDTINNLIYAFRYFPYEATLASCALENCKTENELKAALKNKTADFTFLFEIQSSDWNESVFDKARPELTKSDIVTYLNGQLKSDLKAITSSNDTIACTNILYEPVASNKIRLIISFEAKKNLCEIVLFDRIFSGYKQKFAIPELSLNTIPTLKF